MAEEVRCGECNRDFSGLDALSMHNAAKHHSINKEKNKLSKKSVTTFAIIAVILIGSFWFVYNSSGKDIAGNIFNDNIQQNYKDSSNPSANNEIQKITLGMNGNYYPNTIRVKSGVPVEIALDGSVKGCYRAFSIPGLGISKYLPASSDTIKFTPNKKGTFRFQCSMSMASGTIIVE